MKISAGLVLTYDNKILLVHPTGSKWWGTYSIPKGGEEEDDDDILETAYRETNEEVGLNLDPINYKPQSEGYINYKNKDGEIYKRVHFFIVPLDEEIIINRNKLQKEEIDWAGFLDKKEAEKRIFWRFKPLLNFLK